MKLFTPESARRTLRRVRPAAEAMCALYRSLESRFGARFAPDGPVGRRHFSVLAGFYRAVRALRANGVLIQDPRGGWIDFPAVRDGRPVLLCWHVGERTLAHWHETGVCLAERRPVDDDGPWDPPPALEKPR